MKGPIGRQWESFDHHTVYDAAFSVINTLKTCNEKLSSKEVSGERE